MKKWWHKHHKEHGHHKHPGKHWSDHSWDSDKKYWGSSGSSDGWEHWDKPSSSSGEGKPDWWAWKQPSASSSEDPPQDAFATPGDVQGLFDDDFVAYDDWPVANQGTPMIEEDFFPPMEAQPLMPPEAPMVMEDEGPAVFDEAPPVPFELNEVEPVGLGMNEAQPAELEMNEAPPATSEGQVLGVVAEVEDIPVVELGQAMEESTAEERLEVPDEGN